MKAKDFKETGINLENIVLVDTYHSSRYNVNTRRLTADMFNDVFKKIIKTVGVK